MPPHYLSLLCCLLLVAWPADPAAAATSGAKRDRIDGIIVHAVSGPRCTGGRIEYSGAPGDAAHWKRFFDKHPFLGIHYVVDRDGAVARSTPESRIAHHALDNSDTTIGIELVHEGDGIAPFPDAQIVALIELIKSIRSRHAIPIEAIKGHGDVDHRTFKCSGQVHKTRSDPGANFPWARLRAELQGRPQLIGEPRPVAPPYGLKGPEPAR
jgi:hypothetical protein